MSESYFSGSEYAEYHGKGDKTSFWWIKKFKSWLVSTWECFPDKISSKWGCKKQIDFCSGGQEKEIDAFDQNRKANDWLILAIENSDLFDMLHYELIFKEAAVGWPNGWFPKLRKHISEGENTEAIDIFEAAAKNKPTVNEKFLAWNIWDA